MNGVWEEGKVILDTCRTRKDSVQRDGAEGSDAAGILLCPIFLGPSSVGLGVKRGKRFCVPASERGSKPGWDPLWVAVF